MLLNPIYLLAIYVRCSGVWSADRSSGPEVPGHAGQPGGGQRPGPEGTHGRHPVLPQRQTLTPPETGTL